MYVLQIYSTYKLKVKINLVFFHAFRHFTLHFSTLSLCECVLLRMRTYTGAYKWVCGFK